MKATGTHEDQKEFENRIFGYIVISPAGRPLRTFASKVELLQALRDAVRGHRSLFQSARILHQDVSAQNIIITGAEPKSGAPKGMLIDLDGAMDIDTGPRTPGEVIGTRMFMAIGILKCRAHRYRHDLESFLYVLLWTVVTNRSQSLPAHSTLRAWSEGSWEESAAQKLHAMHKDNFGVLLAEFPPEFRSLKPLADTLRQLLFPVVDGTLWTATDGSREGTDALYNGIIGALDDATSSEMAGEAKASLLGVQ